MIMLTMVLGLQAQGRIVLRVHQGEKIGAALQEAKKAYEANGDSCTILIEPGTYCEELTIDVPNLTLKNAAETPSIAMKNGGVDIDENAVRITWYYGHGYQYGSMGARFNYGGKRERRWNASTLVTAPGFTAENIIFENSFNMYVCDEEAKDTIVDISRAEDLCGLDMSAYWSEKERPKREMPVRPKEVGSTEVQKRMYRERASALSFTSDAKHCILRGCRVVGRQDALYGDHGAEIWVESCVLCGAVDYIFGGMTLVAYKCELVGMCGPEQGDKCYIAAGRGAPADNVEALKQESLNRQGYRTDRWYREKASLDSIPADELVHHGMCFEECVVRHATADELENPGTEPIYLARPWRWWGEMRFECTLAEEGVLNEELFSLGLTKGHPAAFCEVYSHLHKPTFSRTFDVDMEPLCDLPESFKREFFLRWLGWDK